MTACAPRTEEQEVQCGGKRMLIRKGHPVPTFQPQALTVGQRPDKLTENPSSGRRTRLGEDRGFRVPALLGLFIVPFPRFPDVCPWATELAPGG